MEIRMLIFRNLISLYVEDFFASVVVLQCDILFQIYRSRLLILVSALNVFLAVPLHVFVSCCLLKHISEHYISTGL